MRFIQHPSNNLVLGAPEGWNQGELPCGALPVTVMENQGKPCIVSFWKPSDEDLEVLNAGGSVSLWVHGPHPVVAISTEPVAPIPTH